MKQQFFTSTLASKFIKYLLAYTPLPLYPIIEHGQYMVKGTTYLYKDKILKCTKSGIFKVFTEYTTDYNYLFVNEHLKVQSEMLTNYGKIMQRDGTIKNTHLCVTNCLFATNITNFASYDLVNDYVFGESRVGITQQFVSNSSHYDSTTHRFLGDYLRLIKNYYNLNLMSLYNCYTGVVVNNIKINTNAKNDVYVTDVIDENIKVILIPIKFNTEYTVAMDSVQPIVLKGVICRNNHLVKYRTEDATEHFVSNTLGDTPIRLSNTQFNKPFYFSVKREFDETNKYLNEDSKLQQIDKFSNDLYMAIQVPHDFNATVVVLEGHYTNDSHVNISDIRISNVDNHQVIDRVLKSVPSLLLTNDFNQHPFSDKLIPYLLNYTIDTREYIDENVESIETSIDYNPEYKGMWDNKLRYLLYHKYMNINRDDINKQDILGYVDVDIEDAVRKGYMK